MCSSWVWRGALVTPVFAVASLHAQAAPAMPVNPGIDWHPTAAAVTAACDSAMSIGHAALTAFHALPMAQRTVANSFAMLELETQRLTRVAGAGPTLLYVSPDSAVRAASQTCNQEFTNLSIETNADPEIYATAVRLRASGAPTDAADRKLLDLYIETGRKAGAALDSTTRVRTTALLKRLNDLQLAFGVALASDSSRIHIAAAETASVSPELLGTLSRDAGGGYDVPVNESTIGPFLRTEPVSDPRQRFLDVYEERGGPANTRRLEDALAIRDTLAHLFGFPNWAAYQLETHMAKDPTQIMTFIDRIDTNLATARHKEVAQLAALKRSTGDTSPFRMADLGYYSAMLRRTKYDLDPEQVRQYFPVDHVLPAVLGIYEELLGVHFTEYSSPDTWAPGVREFAVTDTKTARPLGYIYFDLYPRANKYDHFATFVWRPGVYWRDGTVDLPVSMIVGNWPAPEPGKPSLLSHGDVITLFHEFGHMMAFTLVRAPYPTLINLRQDFVEAPSQMLENWMWQPSVLARVSKNVKTGKPLPKPLIDRMIALKQLGAAEDNSQQAFYAMYDMRLHTTPGLDPKATWDSLFVRLVGEPILTGADPAAGFGHLMAGYDAGYYGYLWSKVYAQDLFTRFEQSGVMNPATGMAYRRDILEPGAVREPDELLRAFLGRSLSDDAFYRDLGIVTKPY